MALVPNGWVETPMTEHATRFLFIDDDELVISAIRRALRREPFEVYFTSDPESAFRMIKEHGVDVVVSDHSMPSMTGVEFFAILRRLHEGVRRVMLTGQSDREITMGAINNGRVERFIEKPWSNEDLCRVLRELDAEVRAARRKASLPPTQQSAHTSIVRDATGAVVLPSGLAE
jgi:response regulator RpfG family c-di-GMP phosphodiesterase